MTTPAGNDLDRSPLAVVPWAVRLMSHLAVWAAVLVSAINTLASGWQPSGDDAAITFRAHQTFSLHPPVVGLASTASTVGHQLYDPGPLQFWLLAPFVQLDFNRGLVWGAALVIGIMLSTAIEAIWQSGRWLGCAVIAFIVVDLLWLAPWVLANMPWNAYFPIFFLIASIAFAWRVSTGAFEWWPVLVFTASVSGQCHLFFLPPALLLVVLSPLLGLASGRPARYRWLLTGAGVGLLCWLAPAMQHQNLIALWHGNAGKRTYGFAFGLRALARSANPVPVWWGQHVDTINFLPWLQHASALYGAMVLLVLGGIGALAWRSNRRELATLSFVALALSASTVFVYAVFPLANTLSLEYLIDSLWVVGILAWVVVGWGTGVLLVALADRRDHRPSVDAAAMMPELASQGGRWQQLGLPILGLVAIALVASVGLLGISHTLTTEPTDHGAGWSHSENASIDAAASAIEADLPKKGPIYVYLSTGPGGYAHFLESLHITEGVAWRLQVDGWKPALSENLAVYTGTPVAAHQTTPAASVDMRGATVRSIYEGYCWRGASTCYTVKPKDVPAPVNPFRNLTFPH